MRKGWQHCLTWCALFGKQLASKFSLTSWAAFSFNSSAERKIYNSQQCQFHLIQFRGCTRLLSIRFPDIFIASVRLHIFQSFYPQLDLPVLASTKHAKCCRSFDIALITDRLNSDSEVTLPTVVTTLTHFQYWPSMRMRVSNSNDCPTVSSGMMLGLHVRIHVVRASFKSYIPRPCTNAKRCPLREFDPQPLPEHFYLVT